VADFEWTTRDAVDLVRRDRILLLRLGSPAIMASAVVGWWLRYSAPVWAAACFGMTAAWVVSVWSQMRTLPARWQVLQMGPVTVTFGEEEVTWLAAHGTRVLRWEALEVRRLGATWILLVKGHEAAFVPNRCLNAEEAALLSHRLGKAKG